MESLGKGMVIAGLALVLIGGIVWLLGPRWFSGGWLPGDISVRRGNFSFHFPIVTCLVISVVLTVLVRVFNR